MAALKFLAAFCLIATTVLAKVHFNGDKVFRITTQTEEELKFVHTWIQSLMDKLDVWKEPSFVGGDVDIHVRAQDVDSIKKMMTDAKLKFNCLIEDLEKLIEEEAKTNHNLAFNGNYNYNAYNRYSTISAEVRRLASSSRNAEYFSPGRSHKGRTIDGVKVTDGSRMRKQAVWIDGGIHAREWISPATVMYTLKQLVNPEPRFATAVQNALQKYDFYVVPVFNVDGYEYTHTGNRMWRKTRKPGRYCIGADPNRNWDSHFGGAGTSSNECSDIYRGSHANSETEVRQVANKLMEINRAQGLKSYWNVHAYSQLLLYPWSYTTRPTVDDVEIEKGTSQDVDVKYQKRVGDVFANGVYSESRRRFVVGQPSRILYAVAGGSIDWTYEKLGVKYSYAPELRPGRGEMRNGFLLPAQYIRDSGEEFTRGFLNAVNAMR